ncbi:MAG: hypothetical protein EOO73_18790 [Myxococcales bacterium]|nr:MAG: hypothetical protein EOO73_18790 [Myxococcales bacterium]
MRVATFNAGLAVGVLPHVQERLPAVLASLAELEVDVLFVQEFWLEEHWLALRERVRERLPHALRPPPLAVAHGSCSERDLGPLRTCAQQHCAGLRDEALARCVVQHCAPVALRLPTDCLNCIASNPHGTLEEITNRCTGTADAPRGQTRGGLVAYGGSFGTGLLLRHQPLASGGLTFASSINARGAQFARLPSSTLGQLDIFAAHLSPGGAEQAPQVDELLAWIDETTIKGPALLLGDLNTSPGSALFRRITAAGFRSAGDARGTYSGEGLASGRFGDDGWRLDHVLVRGEHLTAPTTRILDEARTIDVEGRPLRSTLSDHAGLLATLSSSSRAE